MTNSSMKIIQDVWRREQTAGAPPVREPDRQNWFIRRCSAYTAALSAAKGRPVTAAVINFGCQMNARDSEKIEGILANAGFLSSDEDHADLVIYNTCTVRENADDKVYGHLGILHKRRESNPDLMIGLCGCMMQESAVVDRLKRSYSFVNLIFGTYNLYKLAELLCTAMETGGLTIDIWQDAKTGAADYGKARLFNSAEAPIVENLPSVRRYPFKSGVNIMFGCNNFCSYCIVPYVRGRERSRRPEDILREIRGLVDDGVVEVMLLGQNVNSYGKNLEPQITFAELLREVCRIDGLKRVRFMTSHPKDLSPELIQVMKEEPLICRHLHLPVQSGSSRILEQMNRHYTREQYLELVARIRAAVPDISLTTDLIVGFPGETEEDFEATLDLVRQAGFDSCYTFQYSRRSHTPAAALTDQVPESVVKERFSRLLTVVQETSAERVGRFLGRTVDVLAEETDDHDGSMLTGRLSENLVVHFPGDASQIGTIVPVHLTVSKGFYYLGEPAGEVR